MKLKLKLKTKPPQDERRLPLGAVLRVEGDIYIVASTGHSTAALICLSDGESWHLWDAPLNSDNTTYDFKTHLLGDTFEVLSGTLEVKK